MTPEQLEDTEAAILQGLDPAGPCTCGSDPDFSCTQVARLKPSEQVAEDAQLLRTLVGPAKSVCATCEHPPHEKACRRNHRTYAGEECLCSDTQVVERNADERAALSRLASQAQAAQVLADALEMWVGTERGHTVDCGSPRDDERECSAECASMRSALRLVGRLP